MRLDGDDDRCSLEGGQEYRLIRAGSEQEVGESHKMAKSTRARVMSLDLPEPEASEFESAPDFSIQRQAVAVGSQLTEFTPAVSTGTRSAISNSLLLAQLAANQAADEFAWYGKYSEVLQHIGWQSGKLA